MRAADYLREKQRMCYSMKHCKECPFVANCSSTEKYAPEKAEELVEEWASKNLEITNAFKFREVFGESVEEIWLLSLTEFKVWLNRKYRGNEVK